MSEPSPRSRFQVHLSTAIVMMFLAGGFLWANTYEHAFTFKTRERRGDLIMQSEHTGRSFGWPCPFYYAETFDYLSGFIVKKSMPTIEFLALALNIAIVLLILFPVWYAC